MNNLDVPPALEVESSRRIFGIETEFGLHFRHDATRKVPAEEVAGALFHSVVEWGRSSNVFLPNGSRMYIDVGAHPEYATAECDDIEQLIAMDKAGERIVGALVAAGEKRLADAGLKGQIHLYKNNTDSSGNSYGCHENYLVRRRADFTAFAQSLLPFLITRQILTGSGVVNGSGRSAKYCFSPRSDHMWEAMSSATTRSRPMINTRDEPHAHADKYRRMHVIVGDSSMAEPTTLLKIGAMDLLIRLAEAGIPMPKMEVAREMQSIREVSRDLSGSVPVGMTDGRQLTASQIQRIYLDHVRGHVGGAIVRTPLVERIVSIWERGIAAVESEDFSGIDTELDWAIKHRLIERYRARTGAGLDDPRVARLDYAYHDISPGRGLYASMADQGLIATVVTSKAITTAMTEPPQSTRARLRGRFVAEGIAARRDFTADWTHLKVVGDAARSVMLKDPFRNEDDRVDVLIEHMQSSPERPS